MSNRTAGVEMVTGIACGNPAERSGFGGDRALGNAPENHRDGDLVRGNPEVCARERTKPGVDREKTLHNATMTACAPMGGLLPRHSPKVAPSEEQEDQDRSDQEGPGFERNSSADGIGGWVVRTQMGKGGQC